MAGLFERGAIYTLGRINTIDEMSLQRFYKLGIFDKDE